ncbi:krr family protein [Schizosaccharomyces japonicus yFS275]|uniref:Krr family protein n=1 Tax=Schizosaccharomyces japonicus (strain yFS275 / FY16936) TaxID=402676 RepID=B6JX38_SCHJY|nr:krr family protein [Schizosaccharomyces japonicus yFS275]EEB05939.1 krr family protein [Schizosaccharomyces japonicus yFS275]
MPRKKSAAKKAREAAERLAKGQQEQAAVVGKKSLLDDDSEEETGDNSLKINKEFARRFEHNKKREELQRLQEKYGNAADEDEDDSDSVVEDSDGELVTPEVDAAILKTIIKIRNKDPEVYNPEATFFKEEDNGVASEVKDETKDKPMTLKDYHRQNLLSGNALKAMEEDDNRDVQDGVPTHTQEQAALREETVRAFHESGEAASEQDEDDFFAVKEKTEEEKQAEESGYEKFLIESVGSAEAKKVLEELSETYVKNREPVLRDSENVENGIKEEDSKFLADYLMNRGWKTDEADKNKSYEDIVREVAEDNEFVEQAETYETKYNFRFEESGGAEIQSHPRIIDDSLRRKDERRKQARERKKQREEEVKRQRREELNRLRNLKQKELEEKLSKVADIAELDSVNLKDIDLDEDFDPQKWEQKMASIFNDDYYEQDAKKPKFSDDIDVGDIEPVETEETPAENSSSVIEGQRKSDKQEKKKKLKSHKRKIEEYLDEKYGDVADTVAGIPTRFKYRQVAPDSFGLEAHEILNATDEQLSELIGLKKLQPYRTPEQIARDKKKYGKKKRLREWKKAVFGKSS